MRADLTSRLARLDRATQQVATEGLSPGQKADLAWSVLAHDGQMPPQTPWHTWIFLGGRGAGKTRAGAEWLAREVQLRPGRYALIGPTLHDVREVMIEGPSGLCNLPGRTRPAYAPSRRRLSWPNGSVAFAFSAEEPERLRGPQFAGAWADEFCAWPDGAGALALLRMGLRLGDRARLAITTTPRPSAALRGLLAEAGCERTDAATRANGRNLSPRFLETLEGLYGGTRLAAQELEGRIVEADGALWRVEDIIRRAGPAPAPMARVVVAVDPPAGTGGSACGIIVAGRAGDRAYVLADRTARNLSPGEWGERVRRTVAEFGCGAVVAEVNQGGDMVGHVLKTAGVTCPVRPVRARLGKAARAEPVAALYQQGRVIHLGELTALEEALLAMTPGGPGEGQDRADALVWAVTDLLLSDGPATPRARSMGPEPRAWGLSAGYGR